MLIVWLAYVSCGGLAVVCAPPGQQIAPLYLPAGLALAFVDTWGLWMLLPIALGGLTVDGAAMWALHGPSAWPQWLPVAAVCGAGAALMAGLSWRWVGGGHIHSLQLDTPRAIGRFLLWGAALGCTLNATLSVGALALGGWIPWSAAPQAAAAWWGGDMMGVVLGTPIGLALIGRPRTSWRPRLGPVAAPLAVATLVLGSAAYSIGHARFQHEAERFSHDANAWIDLTQLKLATYADALLAQRSLAAATLASAPESGERFAQVASPWLAKLPGARSLLWLERDHAEGRTAQGARPEAGEVVNEAARVRWTAPPRDGSSWRGWDALAHPETRQAYERARRDNQVTVSAPLSGASPQARPELLLFHAAYRGEPYTPQARLAAHVGTVALAIDLNEMGNALLPGRPDYLGACLIDVQAQAVLAGPAQCANLSQAAAHHMSRTLDFGGREWRFVLWNQLPVTTETAGLNSWAMISVGVGFVTALGALLLVMTSTAQHLELARDEALSQRQVAERANQAKSEFMSRMSHELRTPLNAVLGFAQVMAMDQREPLSPSQQGRLEQIQQAGWHLLAMIDDVLDIARLDIGALRLQTAPLPIGQELQTAIQLFAPDARKAQLTLHTPTDCPAHWHVMADASRLRQILGHLLSNAIKFNQPGGQIWLTVSEQGEPGHRVLSIRVRDDGLGLNDEQLSQLFQPFNRVGREHGPTEGRGIGLAISRHLAHLMGGELSALGQEGQGAEFQLNLPLCAPPVAVRDEATPPTGAGATTDPDVAGRHSASRHVLYVEDNATNSEVLRAALADRPGLTLTVAETSEDGLAVVHDRLRGQRPELILLDVHLPDASGLELLSLLKSNPDTQRIPVIMVSADALPEQIDAALAAGAACYLTKPVQLSTLLSMMDELLAQPIRSAA